MRTLSRSPPIPPRSATRPTAAAPRSSTSRASGCRGAPEVAAEAVEGELPALALVRDQLLQDRQGDRLGAGPPVLERPGRPGDPREPRLLGQVAADLEVRVHPQVEPAEELH